MNKWKNKRLRRRQLLQRGASLTALATGLGRRELSQATTPQQSPPTPVIYPAVVPGRNLAFPADHGAHPDYRTEWWYFTGWLDTATEPVGVQLTFFRSRTRHSPDNPSRFAPQQLMFAHAALATGSQKKLMHEQLAARADRPMYSLTDTRLQMPSATGQWSMVRAANDSYRAVASSPAFRFDLHLRPQYQPVLQGELGYSLKGPQPRQASYYYSRPQLALSGSLQINGSAIVVAGGTGWLDHEWSSEILDPQAVGWDWIGLNLDNGDALMAFQIRRASGLALHSHARWIRAGKPATTPAPVFTVQRRWRSPRTNTEYPVQFLVTVGQWQCLLQPLIDDQEMDSRRSTGTLYWEGAVQAIAPQSGQVIGRGYLELTGYAGKVRF
ncbi:MAG: lipocalin-like domain-containing protein [Burkholderiaceae bacterium]